MLSGCNIGCDPEINSGYSVGSQTNCNKESTKKSPKKKARETSDKESCFSFIGDSQRTDKKDSHSMCSKAVIAHPAPNFEGLAVVNGEFTRLELANYLGKYLVLFFYPLDFTFVCPTEIVAFSQRVQEFRNINTEVIGCSVDSHFCHLAWTQTPRDVGGVGKVNIPLLSDNTHKISKDYGIYMEEWGHSLRAHFIIDHRGILRQITINDLPVGRSVDETLRLVNAFQFTDSYGEVCPIDWNKGDKGIVPNQEGKKEYFQKKY